MSGNTGAAVTLKPSRFGLASVLGLWLPLAVIVLWALVALTASFLPLAPDQIALEHILLPPGSGLWLGADDLGRSLAERTLVGAQTSFIVAVWVVLVSTVVGTAIGTLSGYLGGSWDLLVVRIIDIFLAFPGILLAIALAGILGPGIENVVIALSVVGWVGYARLARAQVLSLKHREHVQAAIALGAGTGRIVFRHLLPLLMAPLIVEASFGIAGIVIAEAGLSFLGLGVQPPEASWGSMIRDGARYLLVAPHMVLVPGAALMLVVLSVNLLGDRLRDKLDVRNRKR
ncbi:MAG TPA: ABC transporter permease [Gammaproteobacteria bacterium]|nr:ABC transporter permease [Gammaproteobacteria bacterium]